MWDKARLGCQRLSCLGQRAFRGPPTWGLGCSSGSGSHGSAHLPCGLARGWCTQEMSREKSATSAFTPWHSWYPRLKHPSRASRVLGALHRQMEGRSGAPGRGSGGPGAA